MPKPFAVGALPGAADLNALVGRHDAATAEIDVVNTTTETVLYTKSITANHMSTDRMLRLNVIGDYLNDSGAARNLTVKVTFGGTTLYLSTFGNVAVSATRRPFRVEVLLANLGVTNSQFMSGVIYLGSATLTSGGAVGIGEVQGGHETTDSVLGAAKVKVTPFATNGVAALDTTVARTLEVLVTHSAANASLSCRRKYGLLELL